MVAVAVAYSPPPQHSPMFGHLASSHTWTERHATILWVFLYSRRNSSSARCTLRISVLCYTTEPNSGKSEKLYLYCIRLRLFMLKVSNVCFARLKMINVFKYFFLFYNTFIINPTKTKPWQKNWGLSQIVGKYIPHVHCAILIIQLL